jgi:restriction modification system DNA specificity domain protein
MTNKPQFVGERVRLGKLLLDTFSGEWGTEEGESLTPVLRTSNFNEDGSLDYSTPAIRCIPERKVAKKRMFRGDIILEKSGGTPKRPVGIMAFYDSDELALCSNFNQVLRFDEDRILSRFAFHQLRWLKDRNAFDRFTRKTTGLQNLQMKKLIELKLHVPQIEAQTTIADTLDKIVDNQRTLQREIIDLDSLVKSRFVEMFGDPVDDKLWPYVTLAELCTKLGSGATPRGGRSAYKTEGIPLIRSMNVHNGRFVWKDLTYIDDNQAAKLNGVTLMKGDVLLNITGASVARSCILPDELAGGRVNQHVSIVRIDQTKMLPIILNMALINDSYQRFLLNGSRMAGATREAITKEDLKSMMVPLPPLSLQQQFANFAVQVDKSRFISMSRYRDILIKNGYRHPHLQGFNR